MVTPYSPHRDGIASYAVQAVAALRGAGHDVEVLSPGPSAAHHHLDLKGPRGGIALGRRVSGYDQVIVQFHPDVFYRFPMSPAQAIATSAALTAAFRRAAHVEVRLHEIDYRWGQGFSPAALTHRALWKSVDRVTVHTEVERARFIESFGVEPSRVDIAEHGADFVRKTSYEISGARASLGLPADAFVFLSLGFLQPHKGFDRAIRAFTASGLGAAGARLDVAGSVRLDDAAFAAHVDELEELAAADDAVSVHQGYLSDELFDRWLVAADVVVLPYRHIWSSSVLERAVLYGRRVIATDVGGLAQQAAVHGHQVTFIAEGSDFDVRLGAAMRAAAGSVPAAAAAAAAVAATLAETPSWPVGDRVTIQQEVRARAAVRRGARPSRTLAASDSASHSASHSASGSAAVGAPAVSSAPLRRLAPLALPPPTSSRVLARLIKTGVRRLTGWESGAIVWQVNALREATIRALDSQTADGSAPADPLGH